MKVKERCLMYAVPGLLCLIALNQIRLSRTDKLVAWKGGGFGMFSTPDHPTFNRLLQGHGKDAQGREVRIMMPAAVSVKADWDSRWEQARKYPTQENLSASLQQLKDASISPMILPLEEDDPARNLRTGTSPTDVSQIMLTGTRYILVPMGNGRKVSDFLSTVGMDVWELRVQLESGRIKVWYELIATSEGINASKS